jgi:hypothetical protein
VSGFKEIAPDVSMAMHRRQSTRNPRNTQTVQALRFQDDIGVHLEWDRASDRHAGAPAAVRIILVAREARDLRRSPHPVMGATTWTAKGTPVVYVFYDRVEIEATRYAVSLGLVLACALAHEIDMC